MDSSPEKFPSTKKSRKIEKIEKPTMGEGLKKLMEFNKVSVIIYLHIKYF